MPHAAAWLSWVSVPLLKGSAAADSALRGVSRLVVLWRQATTSKAGSIQVRPAFVDSMFKRCGIGHMLMSGRWRASAVVQSWPAPSLAAAGRHCVRLRTLGRCSGGARPGTPDAAWWVILLESPPCRQGICIGIGSMPSGLIRVLGNSICHMGLTAVQSLCVNYACADPVPTSGLGQCLCLVMQHCTAVGFALWPPAFQKGIPACSVHLLSK